MYMHVTLFVIIFLFQCFNNCMLRWPDLRLHLPGLNDVVNLLLIDPKETSPTQISSWKLSRDARDRRRIQGLVPVKQLLSRDKDGATPRDLVSDRPRLESTYALLTTAMEQYGLPIKSAVESKQTNLPRLGSARYKEYLGAIIYTHTVNAV